MRDVDLLQQIQNLLWYYGYENIFGSTYCAGLISPEVISGDAVRLKDIENLGLYLTAEEIAGFAEPYDGVMNIKVINKFYRDQDESDLFPINGRFNVTERAIRNVSKLCSPIYGIEYCYAVDAEIGRLVNEEYL